MKVLVIGNGGREHALAWKIGKSPLLNQLFLWTNNPHLSSLGQTLDYPLDGDFEGLATMVKELEIDLVVCGPEKPLDQGLSDVLARYNIPVFGPNAQAAKLESSKVFAKEVMLEAGIPTASSLTVYNEEDCLAKSLEILSKEGGVVIKASGLASGKGVFVCKDEAEIRNACEYLYETKMKTASNEVILESVLIGRECSFFSFLGNDSTQHIGFAVDFKRLKDNDMGPNTGGMGCYTPVPWLPKDAARTVNTLIIDPLLKTLKRRNIEYVGCLYVGIMWSEKGPSVIEFNVRLGDPEAQILSVADSRDWLQMMWDCIQARHPVQKTVVVGKSKSVVGVVMASHSYPYGEGKDRFLPLANKDLEEDDHSIVFTASVKKKGDQLTTGSGRVLNVVAAANDLGAARRLCYERVARLAGRWPESRWRTDIAKKVASEGLSL